MADWDKIRAEYLATETSYRKLAAKYGLNQATISRRASAEGWVDQRKQIRSKVQAKTAEKIATKKANQQARINDITDKLLDKLEQAVDELDYKITVHKEKIGGEDLEVTNEWREASPGGTVDKSGLRQITAALKDIREIRGIKTDLDKQEQKARIANLRKQAEKDELSKEPIQVVLGEDLEDYTG